MATLPQREAVKQLQVWIPEALFRHLRVEAARRDLKITALVQYCLTSVIGDPAPEVNDDAL